MAHGPTPGDTKVVNGKKYVFVGGDTPGTGTWKFVGNVSSPGHPSPASPSSPSSGNSGGGGGGGGGSVADKSNPYWSFLLGLGIKKGAANAMEKKLVASAANYKGATVTIQTFERWIRVYDTKRYMGTWRGKQDVAKFKADWQTLLPGSKPSTKEYRRYIKGGWTPAQTKAFIMRTDEFKTSYIDKGFRQSLFALRTNPAEFQRWADDFGNIHQQYTGRKPTNAEYKLMFGGHISPTDFKSYADTVYGGAESFNWLTGQPLSKQEMNKGLYGQAGGEQTRSQIVRAYNMRKAADAAKQASYGTSLTEQGAPVMKGVF